MAPMLKILGGAQFLLSSFLSRFGTTTNRNTSETGFLMAIGLAVIMPMNVKIGSKQK